jgi:O-antigen ligase
MPFDEGIQNQLTAILALATLLFITASALPRRISIAVLVLLIPFQAVETRFGTSSIILAYVVAIALVLRKEKIALPLLPQIVFLLLWYLISMSAMHPSTYIHHGVYIFGLISAFFVFWLGYDLAVRARSELTVVNLFIVTNWLVAVYCVVQLWLGPGERFVLFGIDEINMTRVRADGRLTGPFESAEISAQYFVLMQFLILHQFWYVRTSWVKWALGALLALNMAFLVATGSRGEFLVLIGGGGLYLWLFKKRLGLGLTIALAAGGALAITATALIVVNFTQFGNLFDRLQETEFTEQGIPDTRQNTWPAAWAQIVKDPIIGHGPRLRFPLEDKQGVRYDHHEYIKYPHSLYLFLLFTVGVPGMLVFLWFLLSIMYRCWRAMSHFDSSPYYADLARTGFLLVLLFLIEGIKIDQMRFNLADYWHFFFALCGVFVASTARVAQTVREGQKESRRHQTNGRRDLAEEPALGYGTAE